MGGGTRSQLMRGNYDPRGLSETGKALAKKAGQMVAKKAFKHFILTPMFPFLVLPYDIANLADKVLGSDHQTVWLVSLQILCEYFFIYCLMWLWLFSHILFFQCKNFCWLPTVSKSRSTTRDSAPTGPRRTSKYVGIDALFPTKLSVFVKK